MGPFCENAHGVLDGPDQERRQDSQSSQVEDPKAWVADRNYWLCRDVMAQNRLYGPVLSRLELYQFLKLYYFDEGIFEDEDNEDDDGGEGNEENDDDDESLDVSVDPIINEPELK
ncbi:hypothetical protein FANTH_2085 [Fusarium anthophilum]|uniref:Uncharacterized protein n=1 Tax=Fusarium anthophilum TaxID=48485 RepID=A0A8H4ZUG6_9HYPO|nr:hypothetical protein FANTH_2085 [Fusarium anthophilum]